MREIPKLEDNTTLYCDSVIKYMNVINFVFCLWLLVAKVTV